MTQLGLELFEVEKKPFKHESRGLSYHKLNINERIGLKKWAWETYSNGPSAIVFCICFPDVIIRYFNEV